MPTYLDKSTNTYYCKFYYEDYIGTRKQKLKRGFKLQREAKEWERNFLEQQQSSPTMKFSILVDIYMEDVKHRLKPSTVSTKDNLIKSKMIPFFGEIPINEITPKMIRSWQVEMIEYEDMWGKKYKPTYLKIMHTHLAAIFNYAVRYYNLPQNPCVVAGSMGEAKADVMQFLTDEEFKLLMEYPFEEEEVRVALTTLYYTGLRVGELQALTLADIDFDTMTLNISKTYKRIKRQDVITKPKTKKSKRYVLLPTSVGNMIKDFCDRQYGLSETDRIFTIDNQIYGRRLKRACKKQKVKIVRIHDLRHSHASHLIELGYSPFLIAERLGHETVQTTINTYGHLYPNKQQELVAQLENSIKVVSIQ